MKNTLKKFLVVASMATLACAAEYTIDPVHSLAGFEVKHLKISKVKGKFKQYDAKVVYDKDTNELKVLDVELDVKSIDTDNEKRDDHLRSADFFDADKFGKIKFKMTKFKKDGSDEGKIYGDLTIKGVTKPVKLEFEYGGAVKDQKGVEKIGFSIEGSILRSDFKVGENYGDMMISDKVNLEIEVEAVAK